MNEKKEIENEHSESAEKHTENAEDAQDEADKQGEEMGDIWDDISRLGRRMNDLEQLKAQAIRAEQKRRAKMESNKNRACEKILESHDIAPEDESVIRDLEKIKDTASMTCTNTLTGPAVHHTTGKTSGKKRPLKKS